MDTTPLVSIIIPVYNREKLICRSIDAALSQTYKNIEIIVSDNASTDATWEVLKQYAIKDKRVKIYRNETNLGPVRNWAECLKHVNGVYTKILWSDDSMDANFIEKTIRFIQKEDVAFVYTAAKVIDSRNSMKYYEYGKTGFYSTDKFIEDHLIGDKIVPVSPGCAIFRTEDIKDALLINIPNKYQLDFSRFGAGNDLLIFLITCLKYKQFYYLDEMLSIFYGGEDSLTVNNKLGFYYLFSKFYFVENYNVKYRNSFITLLSVTSNKHLVSGISYSYDLKLLLKMVCLRVKRKFIKHYSLI